MPAISSFRSLVAIVLTLVAGTAMVGVGDASVGTWQTVAYLETERHGHTATLLSSGELLVVGGGSWGEDWASTEIYEPLERAVREGPALSTARRHHTATRLRDSRILVCGGWQTMAATALDTCEVFDPLTEEWTMTSSMLWPRAWHTATLLEDGSVLVTGGHSGSSLVVAGEVFDPQTMSWTATGILAEARHHHTATLLENGEVLLVGGSNTDGDPTAPDTTPLGAVEIYEPVSRSFRGTSPLTPGRQNHSANMLPDGTVIVAGGWDGAHITPTCRRFHPSTGSWSSILDLTENRDKHSAVVLPDGRVLVIGGRIAVNEWLGDCGSFPEAYDVATDTWTAAAADPAKRGNMATATVLTDGTALVIGGQCDGQSTTLVLRYNPDQREWNSTVAPFEEIILWGHAATLLPNGLVLVAGGFIGDHETGWSTAACWLWNPSTDQWIATGPMNRARHRHTATLLPEGLVLVVGGESGTYEISEWLDSAELYDPATGEWTETAAMRYDRSWHRAVLLPDGRVLVAGGGPTEAEIYSFDEDTGNGSWSSGGWMHGDRRRSATTLLRDGGVLVAGNFLPPVASAEIFHPVTGGWSPAAAMHTPRDGATATLLHDGTVLVAGGEGVFLERLRSCELYDPIADIWLRTGSLNRVHSIHGTTTVLPDGLVLAVGAWWNVNESVAEIWDPASGEWVLDQIFDHSEGVFCTEQTATFLPDGSVLQVGGYNIHLEPLTTQYLCDLYPGVPEDRRPVIDAAASDERIVPGEPFQIFGTGFFGSAEASQGDTQNSASNYPTVMLRAVDSGKTLFLENSAITDEEDQTTLSFSDVPADLDVGWHLLTVSRAGVPSRAVMVGAGCGQLAMTLQPQGQVVGEGNPVTLSVAADAGRWFQWQICDSGEACSDGALWDDIAGATGSTFTIDSLPTAFSGRKIRSRVYGSCYDPAVPCEDQPEYCQVSATATLTVEDASPPIVDVLTPDGGEYWVLSDASPDVPANPEFVTWSMSDDVRICSVEVALDYSDDSGQTWLEAPTAGGLTASIGSGGTCVHPGVETTSLIYEVPTEPPSGSSGSLYRIRVEAVDHAGNSTMAYSERPFYVVQANPETVQTLILADVERMQDESVMGSDAISANDADSLTTKLYELADHPRVQGFVVDLGAVSSLQAKLDQWDQGTILANEVLFGDGGLHDYLLEELLPVYSGVEYVVLVGGDRVIPFARMVDGGSLHTEDTYVDGGDLGDGSTVGEALASGHYLSDDPLSVLDDLRPGDLDEAVFVPDLAVGRLVERPEEIITTIATFISQDGILDVANRDPDDDHRVLVTGYDFLLDSGRKIRERWKSRLDVSTGDESTAPVNGSLITPDWGEASVADRQDSLESHLGGLGGLHYGVASLNGHATHYEEGVPGTDPHDINGLSSDRIGALDMPGAVVYAVGCHGGLTVPGSDPGDADNSLDLPQTFLGRGAVSYLANTGYGWGLKHGVGYSERLVELFTEELTGGGTVTVGEAFIRSKQRYVLESPRIDDYDAKSLMQWAHYGLPMYAVSTGISTAKANPSLFNAIETNGDGPVVVREVEGKSFKNLPSYLTRLDLQFDLSADSIYTKYDADGEVVETPGCPHEDGCYYTIFNGQVETSTGASDVPLQPMLLYDSRLAGTSQHGVLWKGGIYAEEDGWKAVIGELVSNGGDGSDHGPTPRKAIIRPTSRRVAGGEDPDECRPSDLELNGLVLGAGEAVKADAADLYYTAERLYRGIDLEVFYYNNTAEPSNNCDRNGPLLGDGPFAGKYHQTDGDTLWWEIPASDDAGVWRVVVVTTDNTVDYQDIGYWIPIELEDEDGDNSWTGSMDVGGIDRLTYVVQAVDNRGNVTWLDFVSTQPPASGVDPGLPLPVDVESPIIFADDFESGDESSWSGVVG